MCSPPSQQVVLAEKDFRSSAGKTIKNNDNARQRGPVRFENEMGVPRVHMPE
jgi:hypothetical protein